ncbi:MAG TPA: N-acetyltransferase [Candidatus Coproplasma avistercoris]|nr:N-acetyltransferase [Candidatus Coproplasma avistercoris]
MEIIVRDVRPDDIPALAEIYSYYVKNTAVTFEDDAPDEEEFGRRVAAVRQFYPYLVAENDGVVAGYCHAGRFKDRSAYDWSVETTIYVKHDCRRSGVGAKLYAALEEALRKQGVINLYACIACTGVEDEYLNVDSVNFHERTGYVTVGTFVNCGSKFGRWYDMVWMAKSIGDHVSDPVRPIPYK